MSTMLQDLGEWARLLQRQWFPLGGEGLFNLGITKSITENSTNYYLKK